MKNYLKTISAILLATFVSFSALSQTQGTLTFKFTQVPHTPCYSGNRNVLAVWIQTNTGVFVKTKLRNCCGGSTRDHLPIWGVNAGATANNCSSGNVTDATSGATLSNFGTKTIVWDGRKANGAVNGTEVPDGTYKVLIEETWNHGAANHVSRSFTFTKGPNPDVQTPATDGNFSNISLNWQPATTTEIEETETEETSIDIYPNPSSTGLFSVVSENANQIKVINFIGDVVLNETISNNADGVATVDLSHLPNGIYFFVINEKQKVITRKVILNKQ